MLWLESTLGNHNVCALCRTDVHQNSPGNDNEKIHDIPDVSEVTILVQHQTKRQDF